MIDEVLGTVASGRSQLLDYGINDADAWSVGLSCGGTLRVLAEPFPMDVGRILVDSVRRDRPVILVSPLEDESSPSLLDADGLLMEGVEPPDGVAEASLPSLADRSAREVELAGRTWFVHPFPARERLLIVGGAEITVHLVPLARRLGFETIVMDPHGVFSSGRAFEEDPDRILDGPVGDALPEPGADLYAVLLTHDPTLDDPILHRLLRGNAAYIGALGGRKTQQSRNQRLRDSGFDEDAIERIDGPVGVPIGAATPAEIAVSIAARLVETKRR